MKTGHLPTIRWTGYICFSTTEDNNILLDTPIINRESKKENWKVVCSKAKVKWEVEMFKSFKLPWVHGIFPELLQMGLEIILVSLLTAVGNNIALGRRWAKLVSIPKTSKHNHFDPKCIKPNWLTLFVLETVEKVFDNHVRSNIITRNCLHPHQKAYQAGRWNCSVSANECIKRCNRY